MCGVIGLIYEKQRADLGQISAELLKTLEYRGYDSTGAAIQGPGEAVQLVKGVGAPSVMVHELGIVSMAGQIMCGQVRWATFGAVDQLNAQPHQVRCKTHIYGAHNGNVTNCDDLKAWLTTEGHQVLSDNDGEMVVHTIEHYFAQQLAALDDDQDREARRGAMRRAITIAADRLEGSYAAVVVDPVARRVWAIKQGSSLYFGFGRDEHGGQFKIASSDLSSVLKLTRVVVPMAEGELVEYDATSHQILTVRDSARGPAGTPVEKKPVRSRLRAKDTALVPPFETFMDQEISAQEQTCRDVITAFSGGTEASKVLVPFIDAMPQSELQALEGAMEALRDEYADDSIRESFYELVDGTALSTIIASVPEEIRQRGTTHAHDQLVERLVSSEAGFFADLLPMARNTEDVFAVRLMDVLIESREVRTLARAQDRFTELCLGTRKHGGRIFVVCCGSSFNAAKAAGVYFCEIAQVDLIPVLPGEFRGQYSRTLADGDIFIAVSQSGETKDLIDAMKDVIGSGKDVRRIAIVNNVSSTIGQELSELIIPLRCGPEIAVPATKSFINQLAVFYCLAIAMAERRLDDVEPGDEKRALIADLALRKDRAAQLPALIRETIVSTRAEVDVAAQALYLNPSIHILATRITAIAKEGALKIREVVLNHTEGFEGSEFKHGPNTILGFNTIFGPSQAHAMLTGLGEAIDGMCKEVIGSGDASALPRLIQAATDSVFSLSAEPFSLGREERDILKRHVDRSAIIAQLYADYPLIYVTGPDERDVALTVSQINTHKIRGSVTVVLAEENPSLRQAASKPPSDNENYRSVYIRLPRTNDTAMTTFSATVVLQRLALEMSLLKLQYLDRLDIADHGVHPDVPKNVSKSITVD